MKRIYATGHSIVDGQGVALEFGDDGNIRYYQKKMDFIRRLVEKFNSIQLIKARNDELHALRECAKAVIDYNDGKTSWDYPLGYADRAISLMEEIEKAEKCKGK